MKRYILHLGWVFILVWAFSLATFAKGEEIVFNMGSEPVSVDPLYAMGKAEANVVTNLYQGLVSWEDGQLAPGVAGKWIISNDGTQYRFQLRSTFWSNGAPVLAKDFEAAWFRVIHPKSPGRYNSLMSIIEGVEEYHNGTIGPDKVGFKALGKNVFWVKLKRPCSQFLSYLTLPSFMPMNSQLIASNPDKNLPGNCTNGPYTVAGWEKQRYILLESNPYFRRGQPRNRIRLVFLESNMAVTAFKAGLVQATKGLEDKALKELAIYGDVRQVPSLNCNFIFFNLQRPPFNKPDIRKAFALVTHKETIILKNLNSRAILAPGFVPFGINDPEGKDFRLNVNLAEGPLDGDQARRYLWQAGYPGESEFPPMDLIYREGDQNQRVLEMLAKMWKIDLGIKVNVVSLSWNEYKKRCIEGRFYTAKAGWDGDYPDPMSMLELFRSDSPGNFCRYQSEEYDKLLSMAERLQGKDRSQMLHEAEKKLMLDLPILPLYYGTETYIMGKEMKDLQFTPQGYPMFWTLSV